jgi:hypothetical protein
LRPGRREQRARLPASVALQDPSDCGIRRRRHGAT